MSIIQWDETFSVNDDDLDSQHKTWFGLLNRLHEAMLNADSDSLVQAKADSLKAMIEYTRFHFSTEEAFMKQIDYPGIGEHVELHRKFIEQLNQLSDDYHAGRVLLGTKMIKFMQQWLTDHIKEEDRKYAAFLS